MIQTENQKNKNDPREVLKKRNRGRKLFALVPVLLVLGIMYVIFWDSREELVSQLKETDNKYFILMVALGILYVVIDSIPYKMLVHRLQPSYTLWDSVQITYLGIFLNVTTLGAGIKPGQTDRKSVV